MLTEIKGSKLFLLRIRRDGVWSETTVEGESSFDVWAAAVEDHGILCRIEVVPV